jgi:hypothetical protein
LKIFKGQTPYPFSRASKGSLDFGSSARAASAASISSTGSVSFSFLAAFGFSSFFSFFSSFLAGWEPPVPVKRKMNS